MKAGADAQIVGAPAIQLAQRVGAIKVAGAYAIKERIENVLASIFGIIFLLLAVVVTIETISRKVFNVSLQGADELGGYALAIGSTLAFSLALLGRNHIRVDVFHDKLPRSMQAILNWLSISMLAIFGGFIAWTALNVVRDTQQYNSTAQTPWATPLIWPQSIWLAGLIVFAAVAAALALQASRLFIGGKIDQLNNDFHPKSAKEELNEEIDDIGRRHLTDGFKEREA